MAFGPSPRDDHGILRLGRGEKLSLLERIVVLIVIVAIIVMDGVNLIISPGTDVAASLLGTVTTAAFALYLWSPLVATATFAILFALSFLTETESVTLLAAAIAAVLVIRLGWTALILSYLGGFLLAAASLAFGDLIVPVNVGVHLILATLSGAIGFALRVAAARGRGLEQQLEQQRAAQAEQEREAVLAERRWIAGELHDSIAHHLTVVSLHVQMLDDPEMSRASQEAIRVAAKKAMTDLRFVIELADDGPRASTVQTGDLAAAIDEAREEFESAGLAVRCEGDPLDERLPRGVEIIFARIVRESATNVLKHAGRGEVTMTLSIGDEMAELTVRSPLPATPRRDLPSSRTGLNRMAERVLGASGDFSAGEVDGQWRVVARLPVV